MGSGHADRKRITIEQKHFFRKGALLFHHATMAESLTGTVSWFNVAKGARTAAQAQALPCLFVCSAIEGRYLTLDFASPIFLDCLPSNVGFGAHRFTCQLPPMFRQRELA